MSDVTKLGVLLDASAQRDAVHVAVAPVIASETLYPGQHVGFVAGSTTDVAPIAEGARGFQNKPALGIVDPFLTTRVLKGERCWMFLYPQTITSLRHQWTHPAFDVQPSPMAASEAWLRAYAEKAGVSYGALLEAARDKNHGGDGHRLPSDIPNEVYDDLDTMWRHYEIVTGDTLVDMEERKSAPFWCSC